MIVKKLGLVFLFIIRIRFAKGKSIADVIRSRYGVAFVRKIRKFEKSHYKLRKGYLDLRFLLECKKNNLIPKVLQFKSVNRHLHNSVVYKKRQIKLLGKKIRAERKRIKILEKNTKTIKKELQGTCFCLDFCFFFFFFLSGFCFTNIHESQDCQGRVRAFH